LYFFLKETKKEKHEIKEKVSQGRNITFEPTDEQMKRGGHLNDEI